VLSANPCQTGCNTRYNSPYITSFYNNFKHCEPVFRFLRHKPLNNGDYSP